MGARILAQYAALGGFDFVNVIEAPNNDAMMRISMELGSRGTIRIETMAALNLGGFRRLAAEEGVGVARWFTT